MSNAPLISVGAPHHGTRPNVAADRETGPIAQALATQLHARAVVVSDLRRTVDVNKNPLTLGARVRHHALRYQNALFEQQPRLIIEVHGHVTGNYAVEVSSGFDLNPDAPADALYLAALDSLKQGLPVALAGRIGRRPSVGVYPLDRDVKNPATNTFTFQKIRRARQRAGMAWYGLHIELDAGLRTAESCKAAGYVDALANALATAIQAAFDPLLAGDDDDVVGSLPPTFVERPADSRACKLRAKSAPRKYAIGQVAVVHPEQLKVLNALEGDTLLLRHGDEEMRCTVVPSRTVRPGEVAMPARIRRQLGVGRWSHVTVRRSDRHSAPAVPSTAAGGGYVVVQEQRAARDRHIWLSPGDAERLGLRAGEPLTLWGQPDVSPVSGVAWAGDDTLAARSAALSEPAMKSLLLTLGEVVKCDG
ncbi:MAG: hypothetical protein GXP41_02375 [Chloroflexi bacterium]|nr:hypothetical protein [Chloroflexota bacterium]